MTKIPVRVTSPMLLNALLLDVLSSTGDFCARQQIATSAHIQFFRREGAAHLAPVEVMYKAISISMRELDEWTRDKHESNENPLPRVTGSPREQFR